VPARVDAQSAEQRVQDRAGNHLFDAIGRAAAPKATFIETPAGRRWTYGDMLDWSARLAGALAALGVEPGDRVAVQVEKSAESLMLYLACLRAGAVYLPLNTAYTLAELDYFLGDAEPRMVVCAPGSAKGIAKLAKRCQARVETLDDQGGGSLLALAEQQGSDFADVARAADDLAAILYTSGTTGPAKGVMVTHSMLALAAQSVALCADLREEDRLFVWEPFHHIGGAQVILLPLVRSVSLHIVARFSASRFWQQVGDAGCSHIHHLGGIIQILLKQAPTAYDRAHRVRIAWGGGCAREVWRAFEERFGVQIRECYGMTECSSLTTWNSDGTLGSVGRPAPWFEVDVQDAQGRVLGAGQGRGEIVVRARLPGAITPGYYRNVQASQQAIRSDGFHTGDLGAWDAEGRLYFHGRMSDSVRCKGENVSAFEVESVALRHPQVRDAAMVGVATDVGEHDIQLFIQPQPDCQPDPAEIWTWMAAQLAPYQRPRYIALAVKGWEASRT